MNQNENETIEMRLLLEGIYEKYGYDFRDYAPASLKRRVAKCLNTEHFKTISGLQEKVLHDPKTKVCRIVELFLCHMEMPYDPA